MTDKQENKRSMYLAVQKVCKTNNSIWSPLPAFVTAFADYETVIAAIDTQSQIQKGKTKGITDNKQKEEDEMIQITVEIAAAVYAYAAKIDDNELLQNVNYSSSFLGKQRDTDLKDICQKIHDEANSVIANLADYGKTAADLTQQQKEIDDYVAIIAKPRTATGTKATATAQLIGLFKNGDKTLKNRLDKLMEKFKKTHPKFYLAYQNARTIVDLGAKSDTPQSAPVPPPVS